MEVLIWVSSLFMDKNDCNKSEADTGVVVVKIYDYKTW